MLNELILTGLFKVLNKIFPFLAKKIYPESKFRKHIDIDVLSTNPIEISLNGRIPEITIHLKITNRSPYIDVKFDRAVFELWVKSDRGFQPLLYNFWILTPIYIRKGESEEIFCQKELNKFQVEFVEEIKNSKEITASLLRFNSCFTSTLYPDIVLDTKLKNKPCRVS